MQRGAPAEHAGKAQAGPGAGGEQPKGKGGGKREWLKAKGEKVWESLLGGGGAGAGGRGAARAGGAVGETGGEAGGETGGEAGGAKDADLRAALSPLAQRGLQGEEIVDAAMCDETLVGRFAPPLALYTLRFTLALYK
jgi:hypothetical protein